MTSMYETALAGAYAQLPSAVRRFHRLSGNTAMDGFVEITPAATWLGRLLSRMLGAPVSLQRGPMQFELAATPTVETWTRHFPSHTMRSTLQLVDRCVTEHLGAARVVFALTPSELALRLTLAKMSFLGFPCPRWLMPRVIAEESGQGTQMFFCITASLPLVGRIIDYRGHLVVPGDAS